MYKIKSPSGKTHTVQAESIYHAIQLTIQLDGGLFTTSEYFKLNKIKK
jgi:hypothetical protein